MNLASVPEISREDPQAIATFFCLAAVGVKDLQGDVTFWGLKWTKKDTIRPNTIIAITDQSDLGGC
jgi:hypothetical protein